MHRTPSLLKSSRIEKTAFVKKTTIVALVLAAIVAAHGTITAYGQSTSPETAAIQAKITSERVAIGKGIATHDATILSRYWSPTLIVNGPTNTIVSRAQIIEASIHGGLNYTSLKGNLEFFTVTNGTAILMGHEDLVEADGPRAGKHLVRRTTDIYQRSGDDWPLVARQATFVGFDATPAAGPAAANYTPPAPTHETAAIQAQIEANGRACGHAIATNDFATLEKLWSPSLVVNSPGNRVLTREGVFTAMREDKLNYTSGKVFPETFFIVNDLAITMGHEEIVMANGPMAGQPLKRRYTDVWQKTGESWLLIARQATYVGIDGGAVYGHPDPTIDPVALAAPATAQTAAFSGSSEDIAAIEALVHSNPSDHVTPDVSFTNIFGTVRFGREEFIQRHKEIAQTFFKGTTSKSSITKLRFVRPDVAVVDVSGELSGFQKVYPGLPVGKDGTLRNKLLLVLIKENGTWWITEFHNVAQTPEV
jgi:uncharacterized protein (TIGR02246 family)